MRSHRRRQNSNYSSIPVVDEDDNVDDDDVDDIDNVEASVESVKKAKEAKEKDANIYISEFGNLCDIALFASNLTDVTVCANATLSKAILAFFATSVFLLTFNRSLKLSSPLFQLLKLIAHEIPFAAVRFWMINNNFTMSTMSYFLVQKNVASIIFTILNLFIALAKLVLRDREEKRKENILLQDFTMQHPKFQATTPTATTRTKQTVRKSQLATHVCQDGEEIDDILSVHDNEEWIPNLNLKVSDRNFIENNLWLSDEVMKAVLQLTTECSGNSVLARPKPIAGVTGIGQGYCFLCDDSQWILATSIGGVLSIFDSFGCGSLSRSLQKQLLTKFHCLAHGRYLSVRICPSMKQTNFNDCGLYAIANLMELMTGNDPFNVVFDTAKMRPFLIECLNNGEIKRFPSRPNQIGTTPEATYIAIAL